MNDELFLMQFEAGTLTELDHRSHVRLAWIYLGRLPAEVSLLRLCVGLRAFAERVGHPGKYHATITWAYHSLIAERRRDGETFDEFQARCPELFDGSALTAHYPSALLHSERARSMFVLPQP